MCSARPPGHAGLPGMVLGRGRNSCRPSDSNEPLPGWVRHASWGAALSDWLVGFRGISFLEPLLAWYLGPGGRKRPGGFQRTAAATAPGGLALDWLPSSAPPTSRGRPGCRLGPRRHGVLGRGHNFLLVLWLHSTVPGGGARPHRPDAHRGRGVGTGAPYHSFWLECPGHSRHGRGAASLKLSGRACVPEVPK